MATKSGKKFKSAYVLGKFLPFHKGHAFLIDIAAEQSEKVTVLISSLPTEPIDGKLRFQWLCEYYRDKSNIIIKHCEDVLPQYPEEHPDFWNIWKNIALRYCPEDLDVIFSSEDYGFKYAEVLNIKHVLVDKERVNYPYSGTKIRENSMEYWNGITDIVKPYFVRKIAIVGAESSGKSTLTRKLAQMYHTNYVEEYGRVVYENSNPFTEEHFLEIIKGHSILKNSLIKQSYKYLFLDTEELTSEIFFDMYFPNGDKEIKKKLQEATLNSKYDLYILVKPNIQGVQDGTRNFLNERLEHYEKIKLELEQRNLPFKVLDTQYDMAGFADRIIIDYFYKPSHN